MTRAGEHFDVLIVGAGISGISGAWQLRHQRPGTSFVVLEAEGSFGGTWLTRRFPGIRSDSDLYTFGFSFKPWVGPPIATARRWSIVDRRQSRQPIAACSFATRSVFSHEKPPSGSGWRPKCP